MHKILIIMSVFIIGLSKATDLEFKNCILINKPTHRLIYAQSFGSKENPHPVYSYVTRVNEFTDKYSKAVWILEPAKDYNDTYYIKSHRYPEEYMRIGEIEKLYWIIQTNLRQVYTIKPKTTHLDDLNYMWVILKNDDNTFSVHSKKFDEPLIVEYGNMIYSTPVYTRYQAKKPYPNSWFIKC